MRAVFFLLAFLSSAAHAQLPEDSPYLGGLDARQAAAAQALGTARGLHEVCGVAVWDGAVAQAYLAGEVGAAERETQGDFGRVFAFYRGRAAARFEGKALAACVALDAGYGAGGTAIPGLVS